MMQAGISADTETTEASDSPGWHAAHVAARHGGAAACALLIRAGCQLECRTPGGGATSHVGSRVIQTPDIVYVVWKNTNGAYQAAFE
jgi:hypothetical protein